MKRDGRLQRADLPRPIKLARASADRILRGIDLTPDQASDELTDFIDLFATRNLARAWTLA